MSSIGRFSMVKVVVAICILFSMLIIPAKHSYASSYSYRTYPEGNVGILRPEIGAVLNFGELKPNTYQFFLNGQEQKVTYDTANSKYNYLPSTDLKPGEYKAQLTFSFSGYEPIYLNWTFTILPNATQLSTDITAEQQEGLKAINDYRAKLGLPAVKLNSVLNTAAQKHAEYLYQNNIDPIHTSVSLHDENASLPGFIGQTLKERSQYVSYRHGIAEDVAYVHATTAEAIDSLFDAPYHRTPFMLTGLFEVGIYTKGDYHVVEFGIDGIDLGKSPDLDVSPRNNDFYVPTQFDGHEVPDPIRNYPKAEYPVGYPIMAVVNDFEVTKVSNIVAELRDSNGNKIPIWINSSENDDHLDNEVMLIPQKPLQLDTTYKAWVSLKATMKDGKTKPFTKEWSFRTEPKEGLGLLTLHSDSTAYSAEMSIRGLNRTHTVSFGLNADRYYLDSFPFSMKKKPYITDGTSYLYIRDLAAAIGATVEWDDSNKAAIYKKKDMTVIFYTNRNAYAINGKEYPSDAAAKLIDETTMIPVRLLSETLGAKVDYVEISRTVLIHF
ncbi:stalk domain-containing protein [Paenibacillus roseipurpureus]|uniref:Stalk domain-containing protein n=1 Tax=Paenibacillus roseopurpureus TaxID=2918901 RepID=A0AA96LT42_9BACL|nr:stalk domain-containing protein [Paenibacillus sp. MBLB1832]WNR45463.1 stalk domain-containing protein [Paenibacillus sp. MBLB1832]